MKMSVETARAFGIAFGMWAEENGACFRDGGCDCVGVEEDPIMEAFIKEGTVYQNPKVSTDEFLESPVYLTMWEEMYRTARARAIERTKQA